MKKKILLLLLAIVLIITAFAVFFPKKEKSLTKSEIIAKNMAIIQSVENELLVCIAYLEDFSATSYNDCPQNPKAGAWTIGYGSTRYPKGSPVKKRKSAISKSYGTNCVSAHLEKSVYPAVKLIEVELDTAQLMGIACFVYNVGMKNFKKSDFLKTINSTNFDNDYHFDDLLKIAGKMTGFRKAGGTTAGGLLKRHWVQGAIFCGVINPRDILTLNPCGFYGNLDWKKYFEPKLNQTGHYTPKFDTATVNNFISINKSKRTTACILPKSVVKSIQK